MKEGYAKIIIKVNLAEADSFFSELKKIDENIGTFVEISTKKNTQYIKNIVKADIGKDWETGEYTGMVTVPENFVKQAKTTILNGDFSTELKNCVSSWMMMYKQGFRIDITVNDDSYANFVEYMKNIDEDIYEKIVSAYEDTKEWKNSILTVMKENMSTSEYKKWCSETNLLNIAQYDAAGFPADLWHDIQEDVRKYNVRINISKIRMIKKKERNE